MSTPETQSFALALLNALGLPPNSATTVRIASIIGASGTLTPVQSPIVYNPSNGALTLSTVPQSLVEGLEGDLANKLDVDGDASLASVTPSVGGYSRQWRDIASDRVNVRNFGALGNGTHDDTSAIQAAIDACPDGGCVWIPSGRYKITSTLTVNNHIRIYGDFVGTSYTNSFGDAIWAVGGSAKGTVLESHLTSGAVIHVLNDPRYLSTSIENLSLLSVRDDTATSIGLHIDFSIRGHYRNIWIYNFKKGIYNNGAENIIFSNIFIVGCDVGCVWDNTANANTLTNFNISGCHTGMTITASTDNMISNSSIQGCTLNGIVVRTNSTCNIFQNIYFENLGMSGYALDSDSSHTIVQYVHFGTTEDRLKLTGNFSHIYPTQQCADLTLHGFNNIVFGTWTGTVSMNPDAQGLTYWFDRSTEFRTGTDIRLEAGKALLLHSAGSEQRLYRDATSQTGDTVLQTPGKFRIANEGGNDQAWVDTADGSFHAAKFTPTTAITSSGVTSGFTAGSGTTVTSQSTFTGGVGTTAYTLGDVVNVFKRLGLLPM